MVIKINIFNCGILRTPTYIDGINYKHKFGLFLKKDSKIEKLNTKYNIYGLINNEIIYNIALFPEIWNKINLYNVKSLIIGDRIWFMKYGYLTITFNKNTFFIKSK